jgi:hypothetical protein
MEIKRRYKHSLENKVGEVLQLKFLLRIRRIPASILASHTGYPDNTIILWFGLVRPNKLLYSNI